MINSSRKETNLDWVVGAEKYRLVFQNCATGILRFQSVSSMASKTFCLLFLAHHVLGRTDVILLTLSFPKSMITLDRLSLLPRLYLLVDLGVKQGVSYFFEELFPPQLTLEKNWAYIDGSSFVELPSVNFCLKPANFIWSYDVISFSFANENSLSLLYRY